MAVSVKFAGAISGIAVTTISVGSGVALSSTSIVGGSVFVAAVLGVAVAAISVGLAVGDKSAAVSCPALIDGGADGGQCQIRWRDFCRCRRYRSAAASVGDSVRVCARRRRAISATGPAVNPALVNRGADGGQRQIRWRDFWYRRREDFRRKRRRARQLCLCRGCARRLLSLRYLSDLPSATSLQLSTPGALRSWRGWR